MRNFIIVVGLAAVAIIVTSVSLKVFNPSLLSNLSPQSKQTSTQKSQPATTTQQKSTNQATSGIPVDPNNEKVSSVKIVYTFKGVRLNKITDTGKGLRLNTGLNSKGVNFGIIANDKTEISFVEKDNKEIPATLQDLKAGQAIRITAEYYPKKNSWSTKKVGILVNVPSGTPSN